MKQRVNILKGSEYFPYRLYMFTFSQRHLFAQLDLLESAPKVSCVLKFPAWGYRQAYFHSVKMPSTGSTGLARICPKLTCHACYKSRTEDINKFIFTPSQSATDLQNNISITWQMVKRPTDGPAFSAKGAGCQSACEGGTRTRTSLLAALIISVSIYRYRYRHMFYLLYYTHYFIYIYIYIYIYVESAVVPIAERPLCPPILWSLDSQVQTPKVHKSVLDVLGIDKRPRSWIVHALKRL